MVVEKLKGYKEIHMGYNAANGKKFEDLIKAGIIDPTRLCVRGAKRRLHSGLVLTTVHHHRSRNPNHRPMANPGMGGGIC